MKSAIGFLVKAILAVSSVSSLAHANVMVSSYPGLDSTGGDYKSFTTDNLDACEQNCQGDGFCTAAEYNSANGACYLKSTTATLTQAQDGILILKELSWTDGIDFTGGDYNSFTMNDVQDCSRACFVDGQCKAFTFNTQNHACYLKSFINTVNQNGIAESGSN